MNDSVRNEFLKNFDKVLDPDHKPEKKQISKSEVVKIAKMLKYRWLREAPHLKTEINSIKFEYRKGAWMVKEDSVSNAELTLIIKRDRLL